MKVFLKTLKQTIYEIVNISQDSTVEELKLLAETTHKIDRNSIKLLYKGQILEDSKKLSSYKIDDGANIILMNIKVVPINLDRQPEESKIESNEKINQMKYNPEDIKKLKELGYTKEQSELALKEANGNIEIAIEMLENDDENFFPDEEYDFDEEGLELSDENEFEINEDLIEDVASVVKIMIKDDHSKLQEVLKNLSELYPDLINIISENEEELKVLISQPITSHDQAVYNEFMSKKSKKKNAVNFSLNNQLNNLNQNEENTLNDKDKEAIQRLISFGFSESESKMAYIACDKDENLAANFLFENKFDGQK